MYLGLPVEDVPSAAAAHIPSPHTLPPLQYAVFEVSRAARSSTYPIPSEKLEVDLFLPNHSLCQRSKQINAAAKADSEA